VIGLSGAQRVGKSTLAQVWSERTGKPFVATSASATFKRLGLDPRLDYDFATRLAVQVQILNDCVKAYRDAGADFITDRTPLDFMAYLLADVQRQNVRGVEEAALMTYMNDCYHVLNAYFPVVLIVQPGIPLIEEEGKAPANPPHMEHINSLLLGLAVDERFHGAHYFVPRKYLDIEQRLQCVDWARRKVLAQHETYVTNLREQGRQPIYH
jgi:hypothetical protein